MRNPRNSSWTTKNDVLYLSFGKPKEADDSVEPQEGAVIRSTKGELVGMTIVGLRKCRLA